MEPMWDEEKEKKFKKNVSTEWAHSNIFPIGTVEYIERHWVWAKNFQ